MNPRKKIKNWTWVIFMSFASWLTPASFLISKPALAQPTTTIVRVDAIDGLAEPSSPGDDWDNAFKYLSDALAYVASQNPGFDDEFEIWVASGVYRPDESAIDPTGDDDRSKTFAMQNFVRLYGGFQGLDYPGGGETNKNQRDPTNNVSTLSGDLLEDNVSNPVDPAE